MRKGNALIGAGLALIAAALVLTLVNISDGARAERAAAQAAAQLAAALPSDTEDAPLPDTVEDELIVPDYLLDPTREMPVETVDGVDYVGMLRIPALDLALPVIDRWSDVLLRLAPCRYSGSAYTGELVICAHNYRAHFGSLSRLSVGDTVYFTDMDGNEFRYEVASLETLQPTAIEEMTASGWALTLFTCTLGGRTRLAVRCAAAE